MKDIALLTSDGSLKKELSSVIPPGFRVIGELKKGFKGTVFFDIDSLQPSEIRNISACPVIAVTSRNDPDTVMRAVTYGAYEVINRPFDKESLWEILLELDTLTGELSKVVELRASHPAPTCAIVGNSPGTISVCKRLARLSQVEVPVLITGETGTGKELIAESIAQFSKRFGKPFVVINCAAVPEALLESELFGFEKGSFTGAVASKSGLLKIADEGTVFFDEVGELPLPLQGKLLRFLQTQAFYPIGSTEEVQVNVRVISATNRDIPSMIREGKFRDDLYHRLRVSELNVPPLRERKSDILPLVRFFVERYRHTSPKLIKGITKGFLKKLMSHDWPGNIRELENTVRSAIAVCKTDYLTSQELKDMGGHAGNSHVMPLAGTISSVIIPYLKDAIDNKESGIYEKIHSEIDRPLLDYVLSYTRENQSEAARLLGINRLTLRKKLGYGRK